MKKLFPCLFFLMSAGAIAQSKDETSIHRLLNEQTIAWNHGDIETFMKPYWQNDSLMFIGNSGITYGWTKTLEQYKKSYPDTTVMGKLSYTILNTKQLSGDYFHVTGKWHLSRSIGNLQGYFSLLFRKIKSGWVIIADHSS